MKYLFIAGAVLINLVGWILTALAAVGIVLGLITLIVSSREQGLRWLLGGAGCLALRGLWQFTVWGLLAGLEHTGLGIRLDRTTIVPRSPKPGTHRQEPQ
jgi:hypothetical protein